MNSKKSTLFLILLFSFILLECGNRNDSPSSNIVVIDISPPSPSIPQQNNSLTIQFTAIARDSTFNGIPGVTFTWSSSNQAVACIDSTGNATAQSNGSSTITAKAGGIIGSTPLTVTGGVNFPPPPPPGSCL